MTITDRDVALDNIRSNVQRNGVDVSVRELTWGRDIENFVATFDVVLGADIIYIEDTFNDLLRTMEHLSDDKTLVIIACRIRYERDNRFLDMLRGAFAVTVSFYDEMRNVQILSARKHVHGEI